MTTLTLKPHSNFLFFLLYFLLLTQFPPPAAAQLPNTLTPPPPADRFSRLKFDKSIFIVLVIVVVVFFILVFLSLYIRSLGGRFDLSITIARRNRGMDREIIETFPTFVYSTVKSLKIGVATLECAVCLNEFEEDETLRLIPKCSHVFHPDCIDAWLANHSTCPVCRANLAPNPKPDDDPSFVAIPIMDPDQSVLNSPIRPESTDSRSPKVNDSSNQNQNRSLRSRSTGFKMASWFPRSHSTGHSLVRPGENCERFTLRLPEEVRNQLISSTALSRTKSCSVAFTRQSSGRRGYRTRSVGNSLSPHVRSYATRNSSSSPHVRGWFSRSRSAKESIKEDVGERSSDRLFSNTTRDNEV